MNTPEQNYQVFNPGVNAPVTVTLAFQSLEDAAWVEAAVVCIKRDGKLSPLMAGILRGSLQGTVTLAVQKDGVPVTPARLQQERGKAV